MQGGGWHEIPGAWKERMPKLPGIITGIKKNPQYRQRWHLKPDDLS